MAHGIPDGCRRGVVVQGVGDMGVAEPVRTDRSFDTCTVCNATNTAKYRAGSAWPSEIIPAYEQIAGTMADTFGSPHACDRQAYNSIFSTLSVDGNPAFSLTRLDVAHLNVAQLGDSKTSIVEPRHDESVYIVGTTSKKKVYFIG